MTGFAKCAMVAVAGLGFWGISKSIWNHMMDGYERGCSVPVDNNETCEQAEIAADKEFTAWVRQQRTP